MDAVGGAAAGAVATGAVTAATSTVGRLIEHKNNLLVLEVNVSLLRGRRDDIRKQKDDHPLYEGLRAVDEWIGECDKMITEAEALLNREKAQVNKFTKFFRRMFDCGKLPKCVMKVKELLDFHIEESSSRFVSPRDLMPYNRLFKKLSWYSEVVQRVKEGTNQVICIKGGPGSGISTFMEFLNIYLLTEYNRVIFIGKTINTVELIQREIVSKLQLGTSDEVMQKSTSDLRSLIARALFNMDFVIIFEKLSCPIKPEEIGFMFKSRTKLIFGTNLDGVAVEMMPDYVHRVLSLTAEDQKALLLLKSGLAANTADTDLPAGFNNVLQECNGNPKLISWVGAAVRNLTPAAWQLANVAARLAAVNLQNITDKDDVAVLKFHGACLADGPAAPLEMWEWVEEEYKKVTGGAGN